MPRSESWGYSGRSDVLSHTVDAGATAYTYDDEGQLLSESRTGYATSYTYDGNGNRKTRVVNGSTETYSYEVGDKLTGIAYSAGGSRSFTYDLAGRMLTDTLNTRAFFWTADSRLASVTASTGNESYTYCAFGTRVKVGARTFLRAGAGIVDDVLSDGSAAYTPGSSEVRSGETTYNHSGLKHAGAQSSQLGAVSGTATYDAFGAAVSGSGSWAGPFGAGAEFGYETDGSALTLIGERYYDPSIGRFLSRDPAGWGSNWYSYCENDPVAFYDAQGEFPDRITGYTWHGLHSAISHDNVGIKPRAIRDTVRDGNVKFQPGRGTWRFDGPKGTVVLNQDGKVVTAWARAKDSFRHAPPPKAGVTPPRGGGTPGLPRPGPGRGGSGGGVGMFGTLVLGLDAFQEGFRHVFFYRIRLKAHLRAIDEDDGEADKWEGVEG